MDRATSPRPRRRLLAVVGCALVAFAAAVWNTSSVGLLPPRIAPRPIDLAGAETHVLVDRAAPLLTDHRAGSADFDSLGRRATMLASVMASRSVLDGVARRMGIPADQLGGSAPITQDVPIALTEPGSEKRATDILLSRYRYRVDAEPRQVGPIIDIYARAPTAPEAQRLADEAVAGLRRFVSAASARAGLAPERRLRVEQLGPADAAVLTHARPLIAVLTFVVAFGIAAAALVVVTRARRGWLLHRERAVQLMPALALGTAGAGSPGTAGAGTLGTAGAGALVVSPATRLPARSSATVIRLRRARAHAGDWPRTTRILPWMVALFIAMLWLVPFNCIQLGSSGPVDLHLDRMLLPFMAGLWLLTMMLRRPDSPRIRLTWIHGGVAAFVAVAFLGVVLDAGYLNTTLELPLAIKKLSLLVAYATVFLLVASIVRRSEVRAFLSYSLALSALCAIGMIIEYRFRVNLFYQWSANLLPPPFQVAMVDSHHIDEIGRPAIVGPAQLGLEAVAMLSVALPIGLVGLLQSPTRRGRFLNGLAVILILAAAIATYRKSAFIAPIAVVLTLAYFRRRELLRLAPLGVVALVAIHVLSPGAFGSVAFQLNKNHLGVATVSDRTADYDAVRPDLWTHMAFGRGFGSYDHTSYRILDSEILSRVVESGILGLLLYFMIFVSVVAVARGTIRSRDPEWAPIALIGTAAAIGFMTLSGLYDVMSFPHPPYLILVMAAFVAVAVKPPEEEEALS